MYVPYIVDDSGNASRWKPRDASQQSVFASKMKDLEVYFRSILPVARLSSSSRLFSTMHVPATTLCLCEPLVIYFMYWWEGVPTQGVEGKPTLAMNLAFF